MKKILLLIIASLTISTAVAQKKHFSMEWGLMQVNGTFEDDSNQGLFTVTKFYNERTALNVGVGLAGYSNSDYFTIEISGLHSMLNDRVWTWAGTNIAKDPATLAPLLGTRINIINSRKGVFYAGYRHVFRENQEGYFSIGFSVVLPQR